MIIKILGTGCPKCKRLEDHTEKALEQAGIEAEVVKVTETEEIMGYGVMSTPALVVDDTLLSYGYVPSIKDIAGVLSAYVKNPPKNNSCHGCSGCSGSCC